MIPLHRKLHQPKAETLAPLRQSPPHAAEERMRPERRQPLQNPQGSLGRAGRLGARGEPLAALERRREAFAMLHPYDALVIGDDAFTLQQKVQTSVPETRSLDGELA